MNELREFNLAARGITATYDYPDAEYTVRFSHVGAEIVIAPSTTGLALSFDASTPTWVIEAARKLDALGSLGRNWDSYGGLPISPGARAITFDALGWLKNQDLPVPAVVLGSSGTVHLEWRSNGKKLELGFGENGMSEYLKVDRHGTAEDDEDMECADAEAREKITYLAEWLRSTP